MTEYWARRVEMRNVGNGRFGIVVRAMPPWQLRGAPAVGVAIVNYVLDWRLDAVVSDGDGGRPNRGGYYRNLRNATPHRGNQYLLNRVGRPTVRWRGAAARGGARGRRRFGASSWRASA